MQSAMLLALFAAVQAQAETYKCRDAGGRITYSQAPCRGAGSAMSETKPAQTRRGRERVLGACPTREDLRSMQEVTKILAKQGLGKEQAFMETELARAKACKIPGAPYRAFHWKDLVALYPQLSFNDPAVRAEAQVRITRIHEQAAAGQDKPAAAAAASVPRK